MKLHFVLYFCLLFILHCGNLSVDNNANNANNANNLNNTTPAIDPLHLQWVKKALAAWKIDLVDNLRADAIATVATNVWANGDLAANNFIEVVDTLTGNPGVSVAGICTVSFIQSDGSNPAHLLGAIFSAKVEVRKSFLKDSTRSEGEKIAIFIHEIGHCLGLRHANDNSFGSIENCTGGTNASTCVMHSTLGNDRLLPAPEELTAIAATYKPLANTTNARFSKTGTVSIRQRQQPRFYIANTIANGSSAAFIQYSSLPNSSIQLQTIKYIMYEDGTEEEIIK